MIKYLINVKEGREPDPDGSPCHVLLQVGGRDLGDVNLPLGLAVESGEQAELCGVFNRISPKKQPPLFHVVRHDAKKASSILLHHILGSIAGRKKLLSLTLDWAVLNNIGAHSRRD